MFCPCCGMALRMSPTNKRDKDRLRQILLRREEQDRISVRDPVLSKEIISYRDNRRLQDESNAALNQEFGKFIRGVKLQSRKLEGTCYQCRSAK
jgi:hypothetical protein